MIDIEIKRKFDELRIKREVLKAYFYGLFMALIIVLVFGIVLIYTVAFGVDEVDEFDVFLWFAGLAFCVFSLFNLMELKNIKSRIFISKHDDDRL